MLDEEQQKKKTKQKQKHQAQPPDFTKTEILLLLSYLFSYGMMTCSYVIMSYFFWEREGEFAMFVQAL